MAEDALSSPGDYHLCWKVYLGRYTYARTAVAAATAAAWAAKAVCCCCCACVTGSMTCTVPVSPAVETMGAPAVEETMSGKEVAGCWVTTRGPTLLAVRG